MRPKMNTYINRKLNGATSEFTRMKIMLQKSFTSINFRSFWTYWNPIYSYVLMYFIYKPIKDKTTKNIAFVLTFFISGLFHDVIVLLILKRTKFEVSVLFLTYALLISIEDKLKIKNKRMTVRVTYNLAMLFIPAFTIYYFY